MVLRLRDESPGAGDLTPIAKKFDGIEVFPTTGEKGNAKNHKNRNGENRGPTKGVLRNLGLRRFCGVINTVKIP